MKIMVLTLGSGASGPTCAWILLYSVLASAIEMHITTVVITITDCLMPITIPLPSHITRPAYPTSPGWLSILLLAEMASVVWHQ